MNLYRQSFYVLSLGLFMITQSAFAFVPKETAMYFNGPTVSSVTSTTATVSLNPQVLSGITDEEKSGVYFEYNDVHQVCIMVYPTPSECLPKKTEVGKAAVILTDLKPSTTYAVVYKRDNTIRCITSPCPTNDFQSLSVEFTTIASVTAQPATQRHGYVFVRNLGIGSRHADVYTLQTMLMEKGYLHTTPTGYFGALTRQAVKNFQKANNISQTGFVGVLTRAALSSGTSVSSGVVGEYFEGMISEFSTQCFADGICSVTVGGKNVVTTRGWAQGPVGTLKGVESIGALDTKIGVKAKVYAAKMGDGYTLYGSTNFYVEVQ